MTEGYALDRHTPIRYVATALDRAAPAALSVADLVLHYTGYISGDLSRVRRHEGAADDYEAKTWIIRQALNALGDQVAWDGDGYTLAVPFDAIRIDGKPIVRLLKSNSERMGDPFNPLTGGVFSETIRLGKSGGRSKEDDELRDSMRIAGWLPGSVVIQDERGVIISGNRRMAAVEDVRAAGHQIEPVIEVVPFGDGDEADIKRAMTAIFSNMGGKPLSPSDRKALGVRFAQMGWSQENIAEQLRVGQATISRDLAGLIQVDKSTKDQAIAEGRRKSPVAGRPRLVPVPVPEPAPQERTVAVETVEPEFDESPAPPRQVTVVPRPIVPIQPQPSPHTRLDLMLKSKIEDDRVAFPIFDRGGGVAEVQQATGRHTSGDRRAFRDSQERWWGYHYTGKAVYGR